MHRFALAGLMSLALTATALAEPPAAQRTPSRIDYAGFQGLTAEVRDYRAARLVNLERFNAMAREPGTLVLDARSPDAFRRGHIRGAINITLTDFTAPRLAEAIGNPNRRILIYCNNNFEDDRAPVRLKLVQLALNIQTFINLYGYGYRNVYELADSVAMGDPAVHWVAG
jgi:phage shock protein E